ncbi:CoB--CoM heterodisulfide reductase iron-sulfur subunit B family protein [Acidianus sp. HS-5]|uniref:CoB--CoM heterodisulfide reductase iron-sulfur subunit B family protein n=1 Tax=Acidianus sp. HS-5 TaxID=2886040 RepID=UPI001F22B7D4|nr:CoB--CoM heterodisulfide reductase iron-sulfur subunit B family protein [Acidianus sp. HS-5]BDC17246.1 heterodisulfide reductase subunit B [Acidianus sp. HS-5]
MSEQENVDKKLQEEIKNAFPYADTVDWNEVYQRIIYRYSTPHGLQHVKEEMEKLEDEGEIIVHHIKPYNNPIKMQSLNGFPKTIPTNRLWNHKSCGQCGHIPGYPTSVFWMMNKMEIDYMDEPHQTSCTGWNYHASGASNPVALSGVYVRNMWRAYEIDYFPLIHCGTSFGHYKEVRNMIILHKEVREKLRPIMRKLGMDIVVPEEVVHYSEWLYTMSKKAAQQKKYDLSNIKAAVHTPCHVYKLVPEDTIYDPEVWQGRRPAAPTGTVQNFGAKIVDYSTWWDCCGFGFRHILTEREFSRSFALFKKVIPAVEEAHADVFVTSDTGCVTTLDKSQWAGKAHGFNYNLPVLADAQFAAIAMGADPYKIAQIHWHATDVEGFLRKIGVPVDDYKEKFIQYLADLREGKAEPEYLYKPHRKIDFYLSVPERVKWYKGESSQAAKSS